MKTILLVDDSRAVRMAERHALAELPVEVVEAEDGAEALGALRSGRTVDAVLLDWNMPVLDGPGVLRSLRDDPPPGRPRVVMCTTEGETAKILEAVGSGADEYIVKPFTADIVRSKLEQVGVL